MSKKLKTILVLCLCSTFLFGVIYFTSSFAASVEKIKQNEVIELNGVLKCNEYFVKGLVLDSDMGRYKLEGNISELQQYIGRNISVTGYVYYKGNPNVKPPYYNFYVVSYSVL